MATGQAGRRPRRATASRSGAANTASGGIPRSRAATSANVLKADPEGRPPPPAPVARFTLPKRASPHQSRPPTIALTAPDPGSTATSAP